MFHLLLLTLLLLKPDAPAMRLADPAVFVPPPIETEIEYFPSRFEGQSSEPPLNRQKFAVEIVYVVTDRPVEGTTADEMLAKIEEMKKTTGVVHFGKARLVTGEGIRCRERRGYEARCDNARRITTRSFIAASRRDDPPHSLEKWMFFGQTFEARPFFDDKHRLSVDLMYELRVLGDKGAPVTLIQTDDIHNRWFMNHKMNRCQTTVGLTGEKYALGGPVVTEEDELMPDGRHVRIIRMNHYFFKVRPVGLDEK